MKTVEERLREYEPLWENWTYSGNFLGQGAMSSVFEIQSTAMGFKEVAALKILTIKKNHHGVVEIPKEAQTEIMILRELSNCPNIVHYHDSTFRKIYDENNEVSELDVLIKMEKLKPLSESTSLSVEEVVSLAKDMCNALIYASEHNIIHRDIKPQNIFVDEEGTYKLGDFGIAKINSDSAEHFTMNIGTLAYTAPEVRNNPTGVYGISSDIYSLGLVLYLFLNDGYLPFAKTTASIGEAINRRLNGDSFPGPTNGKKMLKSIVMRACSSDTRRRYSTPQEMLEDLESLATGGRALVVDPFATMDANQDLNEEEINPEIIVSPEKKKARSENPADEKYKETTNAGVRLIINMGKTVRPEPKTEPESFVEPEDFNKTKISMGAEKPSENSDKKEKDATSFFNKPRSI